MGKLVSALYKIARTANDISKLASPKKIVRRGVNKLIGRRIGKVYIRGKGNKKRW